LRNSLIFTFNWSMTDRTDHYYTGQGLCRRKFSWQSSPFLLTRTTSSMSRCRSRRHSVWNGRRVLRGSPRETAQKEGMPVPSATPLPPPATSRGRSGVRDPLERSIGERETASASHAALIIGRHLVLAPSLPPTSAAALPLFLSLSLSLSLSSMFCYSVAF
jgi:hypothetical protein